MSPKGSRVRRVRVLRIPDGPDFVEVVDEEGTAGLHGPIARETSVPVLQSVATVLVGCAVSAYEDNWERMMLRARRHGAAGSVMMAVAALDCALWDLRGKVEGRPVFELLGGPTREAVAAYATLLGHDPDADDAAAVARSAVHDGFAGQKWALREGPTQGPRGLDRNVERTRMLREAVGPEHPLMFDALGGWTLPYARDYCARVHPYGLAWLEEPLPPQHRRALARLARQCKVPLAAGEHAYTRHEAHSLVTSAGVQVLQTDVSWSGGLTEALKVAAICSVYGVPLCPHGAGLLPAIHLAAAQPPAVVPMVEYHVTLEPLRQALLDRRVEPRSGRFALPAEPGLGAVLADDARGRIRVIAECGS